MTVLFVAGGVVFVALSVWVQSYWRRSIEGDMCKLGQSPHGGET